VRVWGSHVSPLCGHERFRRSWPSLPDVRPRLRGPNGPMAGALAVLCVVACSAVVASAAVPATDFLASLAAMAASPSFAVAYQLDVLFASLGVANGNAGDDDRDDLRAVC